MLQIAYQASEQSLSIQSETGLRKLLDFANFGLAVSVFLMLLTILLSYPLAELLTIQWQIACHIGTILMATIVKISYVLRCVAQHSLGKEVR